MRYSDDEFLELIQAIEEQGGTHTSEVHEPDRIMMTKKTKAGEKREEVFLTGCGFEALFLVPYAPAEPVTVPVGGPTAELREDRYEQIEHLGEHTDTPSPDEAAIQVQRGAGLLKVCAVDDALGLWPRFVE